MTEKKQTQLQQIVKESKCVCLQDYRELAKKVLSQQIFNYIDSGSDDEITIKRNVKAFQNIVLFPRVLRDGFGINLTCNLWGKQCSMPFGFAPWAMNKITHNVLGQKGPAKIAAKYRLPYMLSTLTNTHPKEISEIYHDGLILMQMYLCNNWQLNMKLVKIAQESGFTGLAITVDAQVLGTRRKEAKYRFDSSKYEFPVLSEITSSSVDGPKERVSYLKNRDLTLSWETVAKIRKLTKLKIILKGILHPADAVIAVNYCDAIYVSNHGGRQLDGVPATIEVLPKIVAAVRHVNKQIPIFIDGGVRTGNDVFKCLALGANFVFIGRPVAYSLIKGEQGVDEMVNILKDELLRCMILNGCNSVKAVTSQYVGFRSKI